ncbi:hypothetical protein FQA39_LY17880 [Lamprigera yunnana]|nr:hypothetical protein FQA39_LY17880 [Lamprigera yunnana]
MESDKIIRMPDIDFEPDPRGVGYVFYSCMKKFKNNIAQIDGITGEKDSYESLLQRCVRTAVKMRNMGVTHEDIISLCTFNHLNSCVPYIATLFLGAKVSALDATLSLQDSVHLLKQVNPKMVFTGVESVDLVEKALDQIKSNAKIIVFGPSNKYESFDKFIEPQIGEDDFEPYEVNDLQRTAFIFFSSGTSGLPKGICIHHYGYLCQHKNVLDFKFCQDILFTFTSLYWVSGSSAVASTIMEGTARLIIPRFNEEQIWNAIEKFKPTMLLSVPFHFLSLHKTKPANVDTSSIQHIGIGGGPLIESQIRNFKEMFPTTEIYGGYGQTEMCVILTIFKPSSERDRELLKTRPTSCGTGIPGVWYKVVDVDSEELLGPNQPGELRLKTKFHLSEYYNMDSSHLWDSDGWYKTGDLVYYDEEKCFFVVDRLKEFLKFRSWHIPPASIENVLLTHPEIFNALVIGIPHEFDENHLMALVVLKNKDTSLTPKDVEMYVEERVDERKRLLAGVRFVNNIPLATTGKVKRRDIKEMVLRGEL